MKKNFNKTANVFLKVLFYIVKNPVFTIDEIIDYMDEKYKITIKYLTVLKYLRTMKKLNYIFKKNQGKYILKFLPFKLDVTDEEIQGFFSQYLQSMKNYDIHCQEKAKKLYLKISPFLKKRNINKLDKIYFSKNLKKTKNPPVPKEFINICLEKIRIKLKYTNGEKNYSAIIEPNEIIFQDGEYFIYAYNEKKKSYELFNINGIISFERLHQKNKYQYKKENALILLTGSLAKSYTKKRGEYQVQKTDDGIIVMTHFYDKKFFFRRILRYQTSCKIVAPLYLKKEFLQFVKELYNLYR